MDAIYDIVRKYDELLKEVSDLSEGKAKLVLASKMVAQDVLMRLAEARPGVIYGENKVQELLSKYFVAEGVEWQFIGRLQTNKVKYIVDKVSMIQSVDSLRLAEEIEKRCAKIEKKMDILLEINVGEEESKGGISPSDLEEMLCRIKEMPHLRLRGIMSVLPNAGEEVLRPLYARLKEIFEELHFVRAESFDIKYLSAGMSGDYKLALQCGSNMVRIGSAVFGARRYDK